MFTGIVQDVGRIRSLEPRGGDVRLVVGVDRLPLGRCALGDSIAVSGVCLTVTAFDAASFAVDVSRETLANTTLGLWQPGSRVNLEPALRAGDALGGHLVSGHVDGVGVIEALVEDARSLRVTVSVPSVLAKYIARKGSVAIEGVSLTVNDVAGTQFGVNLVPHTRAVTNLDELVPGRRVNIEIDQVARYVERLLGERDVS